MDNEMKIPIYEEMWERFQREPEIAALYPRRIAFPGAYMNPAYYSMSIMGCAVNYRDRRKYSPETTAGLIAIQNQLLGYDIPTYFVDRNFLAACDATSPPKDMTFEDVKFPMPAMLLAFPVDYIQQRFGWPLPFCAIAKLETGDIDTHAKLLKFTGSDLEISIQSAMCVFHSPLYVLDGNPVDYVSRYPAKHKLCETETDKSHFEDPAAMEKVIYNHKSPMLGDALIHRDVPMPTVDEEVKLLNEITILSTKVLLAMTARSGFTTTGTQSRKASFKNGVQIKEALWHPNIIGHGYKFSTANNGDSGHHASPKMHWRRGHFHTVLYGKGRSQRRNDWFEPVLVNPPS